MINRKDLCSSSKKEKGRKSQVLRESTFPLLATLKTRPSPNNNCTRFLVTVCQYCCNSITIPLQRLAQSRHSKYICWITKHYIYFALIIVSLNDFNFFVCFFICLFMKQHKNVICFQLCISESVPISLLRTNQAYFLLPPGVWTVIRVRTFTQIHKVNSTFSYWVLF